MVHLEYVNQRRGKPVTQTATEALATIRDNLREAIETYGHIEPGTAGYNIVTALRTLQQGLSNLQAEEEQQLSAAVVLGAIDSEAFHAHILQLLGAHFVTLFDNICALMAKDHGSQAADLKELRNFVAEQSLVIRFATTDKEQ